MGFWLRSDHKFEIIDNGFRGMLDKWVHMLPRLYLDTCTVADALLEPPIETRPAEGRELDRFLSQRIFTGWPKDNLILSPFVLAEFLQLGQHADFGKSLVDMRQLVEQELLPRVSLTFTECDLSLARAYDGMGLEPKFLVRLRLEGSATMPNGERFHGIRGNFQVTRAGQIIRGVFGGIPPDSAGLDPEAEWDADSRVTVEAPAFELAMMDTAAQIVHETNAPWKDAFHYLYATWAHADNIVSTDKKFARRTDKTFANHVSKDGNPPRVVLPSYVEERVLKLAPTFHREVFR